MKSFFLKRLHALHYWPPLWHLKNFSAVVRYRYNPVRLNDIQERIYHELCRTGIAVTHLDELGITDPDFLAYPANNNHPAYYNKSIKKFLGYLWPVVPQFDLFNPLHQFAKCSLIQDIVAAYMRMKPDLYFLTLNRTFPVLEGALPFHSQQWHRDPEDRVVIKIFMYLCDVEENSGPFIYVPCSRKGEKFGNVFPWRFPTRGYAKKIDVPHSDIKICTGKKGTIIFCDTTGLHKGGYATKNERLMFTAGYRTPASITEMKIKV